MIISSAFCILVLFLLVASICLQCYLLYKFNAAELPSIKNIKPGVYTTPLQPASTLVPFLAPNCKAGVTHLTDDHDNKIFPQMSTEQE